MAKYTLYRIEGADRIEVGTFKALDEGFSAGQDVVHADAEHAYALYLAGPCERRVARFAFSRIMQTAHDTSLAGLVLS
jgi:hypothetical protein